MKVSFNGLIKYCDMCYNTNLIKKFEYTAKYDDNSKLCNAVLITFNDGEQEVITNYSMQEFEDCFLRAEKEGLAVCEYR